MFVSLKQGIAPCLVRQTKEVGVVSPECNHLSALNLLSALPCQVMVLVKPDEGILASQLLSVLLSIYLSLFSLSLSFPKTQNV